MRQVYQLVKNTCFAKLFALFDPILQLARRADSQSVNRGSNPRRVAR